MQLNFGVAIVLLTASLLPLKAQESGGVQTETLDGRAQGRLPIGRAVKEGVRITFPVRGTLPLVLPYGYDTHDGPSEVCIAPGVTVRLNRTPEYSRPLEVLETGQKVTFERYFMDHMLWGRDRKAINDLTYLLNRGNASADLYEFFGLERARGMSYLGVAWRSPNDSARPLRAAALFRLDAAGKQVRPVPLRVWKVTDWSLPRLGLSHAGDLLLFSGMRQETKDHVLERLTRTGRWETLPSLPDTSADNRGYLPTVRVYLRGGWVVQDRTMENYSPIPDASADQRLTRVLIEVIDPLTGRVARRFRRDMKHLD